MNIFNSLGSNYDARYVLKALFSVGSRKDIKDLRNLHEEKYHGKAILFYKGREALTFALKILNLPKKSEVAINGFTCVAVFNAIRYAGFEALCLDLDETGGLNFTAKTLENSLKSNKNIKVVIVQNTLGYPCDIEKIEKLCRKHKLILIEDLAHCVGTVYKDGREAGTVGDLVVLSFSQDKMIDAVSGGALIVRNEKYRVPEPKFKTPINQWKDRFYPRFTYRIRLSYSLGLGKPYHFLLKRLNLMPNVLNESFYDYHSLPKWYCKMVLYEFSRLNEQLAHRKKIANIYASKLPNKVLMFDREKTKKAVSLSSNLRFPVFLDNRLGLIKKLKKHGIYLSDIWYTDVAPECPNAVADSKIILNLPTHINVSEQNAKRISDLINQWIQK
ncbi:MAG: hypothetical protein A3C30_02395 [Candidatus Levybacteria bacterium RIFCSPHIGHO2_02_FULL_40_18]|nr:MAG: hypothetical protein A2869_04775 [Candidatus Levybacteria bacterium RIFCSPHIGHO2_01_FULL_40_58]OGH26831.1 MAG: hypothetical protein A3C30_02395 [Candidatus Levybacteria bacterium RIFCSPHIGHO2_02_FULL_40_18]OGH31766.1 MAG: hypothetical protein A3E43_02115 [Candidatus Levybacteria bacterium RIFCSPHIGHO2_12_FULL_40_31]OGH40666.1 MAG: hypothetical protein A2894_00665 [Candidatus Levybacteria bacterium RIFCSPLOWO2_01_FULL_40_64]OGH48838.1 MAG: hypothetical protein A3I54_02510 [Candidatus Lev